MSRRRLPYADNPFQQLRGFYYVAKERSISRAAEKLSLRQSSVSLQVQALELSLNARLFERRGPRIELTRDGETLWQLVRPVIEGFEKISDRFAQERDSLSRGLVRVAAGGSTLQYILPRLVQAFVRRYPGIDLRLHNVTGTRGLELLRAGEIDLAIGPLHERHSEIEFLPLVTYHPVLITAQDHPLAGRARIGLKDIARYPLILPPREQSTWKLVEQAFRRRSLSYDVKLEVGGYDVIKTYVRLGLGVSIVLAHCVQGDSDLYARPLPRFFPSRTYGLVLRRQRHLTAAAQRLVELIVAELPHGHVRSGNEKAIS